MFSDPKKYEEFNKLLNEIPEEEINKKGVEDNTRSEEEFKTFKESFAAGKCSYCKEFLTHFSTQKPCFHWLLKPNGFKKKHFPLLYEREGFHNLEAYLRWVANTEQFGTNINDLVEEKSSTKVIEQTIRYKNLEWSFSSSNGCFKGLPHSHGGKFPHYHFQMKVNGLVIINYNGFHIPFNDYDDFSFAVKAGKFDRLRPHRIHGAGMQEIMNSLEEESILTALQRTEDESTAQFRVQTMLVANEGSTISGDQIADMMEESKKTGVPMWRLIKEMENVSVETIIEPGPGVPEIAARTPNRKPKR